MEEPSTPPVVPLVASSPPSIKATLVDEELVHIANNDQQGQKTNHGRGRGRRRGHGAHGGLHVSPIEPIVEHTYHGRPQQKRKAHFVWYTLRMLLHMTCILDTISILHIIILDKYS